MTEDVSARLRRVEQQIRAFRELHQSELKLILDELSDIARQVEAESVADSVEGTTAESSDPLDPAAASPKRAKWLAEQERKAAPKSRRDLLFRDRDTKT